MSKYQNINKAWLVLLVSLILAGCGSVTTEYVLKPVPVYPPQALIAECDKSEMTGHLTRDLVEYALSLSQEIDKCNEDKKAIRDWRKNLINKKF